MRYTKPNNPMLIYEAIKSKLGDKYENIFYQNMREDQPCDVGIYLTQGLQDNRTVDGQVVYDAINIHIQLNCERSLTGLSDGLNYLSEAVFRLENEESDISNISFISVRHIGPVVVPIGKNKYNIEVVKSDIELLYTYEQEE